jgi:hypothetical protein
MYMRKQHSIDRSKLADFDARRQAHQWADVRTQDWIRYKPSVLEFEDRGRVSKPREPDGAAHHAVGVKGA